MKVAISLPDDTFARVESRVATLRMNRSQFYRLAAENYLEKLDAESITERLTRAIIARGIVADETREFIAMSSIILEPEAGDADW